MRKITWKRRNAMIQAAIPIMIAHWRNQYNIDYLDRWWNKNLPQYAGSGLGKGTSREKAKKRFWHDVSKIAANQYTIGDKDHEEQN